MYKIVALTIACSAIQFENLFLFISRNICIIFYFGATRFADVIVMQTQSVPYTAIYAAAGIIADGGCRSFASVPSTIPWPHVVRRPPDGRARHYKRPRRLAATVGPSPHARAVGARQPRWTHNTRLALSSCWLRIIWAFPGDRPRPGVGVTCQARP